MGSAQSGELHESVTSIKGTLDKVQKTVDNVESVTRKIDERLDPSKATRAAAHLMHDNYNALGSWPLAITAYNHGRGGMLRAQSEVGSSDITKVIEVHLNTFRAAALTFSSQA